MAKDHPTGKSGLYAAFLELETPEECYRFLQDVCSYAELSAMEQRYNIAEKLMRKQSYTSIMGNIGASSAIISANPSTMLTTPTGSSPSTACGIISCAVTHTMQPAAALSSHGLSLIHI